MNYKAIIFDLDGTLMDSLLDIAQSVNVTLQNFGLRERSIEEIRTYVGCGVRKLLIDAFRAAQEEQGENFSEELIDEALPVFRAHYTAHCNDCTRPYDGIPELLEQLKLAGFTMAIVSNKPQREVSILQSAYFSQWIDVAMGEDEASGIRRKPYPDMVWKAMERLGVIKEQCVYVGDSETDFETAKNAGVDCISVLWGFRTETVLRKIGANTFAHSPSDVFSIVSSK